MIVLALLLLIAAAAMVVFIVVTGSTGEIPLEWDDMNVAFAPSPLVLFLLGALTLLLAVLALGLLRAGTKRSTEKRRELKQLRRLQDERDTQADSRETVPGRGDVVDRSQGDHFRKDHDGAGYAADSGGQYGQGAAPRPMHAAPPAGGAPATGPLQPGAQPAPPAPAPRDPGATSYDPR